MKIFERITKRYALQNYYLRRNFHWPDTLPEILDYWQQHNALPFLYGGDNWPYDAMCERQRRKGVYASQYLTPDRTARQMAALIEPLKGWQQVGAPVTIRSAAHEAQMQAVEQLAAAISGDIPGENQ